MYISYEYKELIEKVVIRACVFTIKFCCRSKDNGIASTLHELAGLYQTRPKEGWMPSSN